MAHKPSFAALLERNKLHQEGFQPKPDAITMSEFANKNAQGVFVITCSDPRLNPYSILGIDPSREMGTVMIRNAGGRAFDALRSLAVLGRIGNPGTIVVMHHSDCGLTHFHNAEIKKWLYKISPDAGEAIESIKNYGEITVSIEESIKHDVALLRASPFIKEGVNIVGLKYDVLTGKVEAIESWIR